MKPRRRVSRRSFVGQVAGGVFAAGAFGAFSGRAAAAQATDSDGAPNADPVGHGRGGARSGITDTDPTDPRGNGRGGGSGRVMGQPRAESGASGSAQSDPVNSGPNGTGSAGATAGPTATDGASGRRCTDSDLSPADPVGQGRRC